MRHSKSRLVEDADESAPVRLETAPTPINRDRNRPAPIISLPRFIGGIETEGRKCLFIFGIHHKLPRRQIIPEIGSVSLAAFETHSDYKHLKVVLCVIIDSV